MELNHEDFQKRFLSCIENARYTQLQIALIYVKLLTHYQYLLDIKTIDSAILQRWSPSGLREIQNMAWKLMDGFNMIKREFETNILLED